jgi:thioester reductase-like protein
VTTIWSGIGASRAEARRRTLELIEQDAVLPAGIAPRLLARPTAQHALLTGATGFLGRYALRELLKVPGMRVSCLVRGLDDAQARIRLREALLQTGVTSPSVLDRVEAVRGDVGVPALGLEPQHFESLAATVDAVYHCAAEVNWARSYRQLRATNVCGTLEVIRLACTGRAKPLTFVSTIGVCFAQGDGRPIDEDTDMLPQIEAMPLGYAQSKCVAESLLRQASERGLPVTIVRPALISGDSRTGDVNLDDVFAALVEGCTRSGVAIDVDWLVDCVPVDFVAAVLARIPAPRSCEPQVLHLTHDGARHWREVVLWMNLYGCPVKLVATHDWLERAFVRRGTAGTRLYAYRRFFQGVTTSERTQRPFEAYLEPNQRRVASRRTHELLGRLGIAPPPLDGPLLHRYFERYRCAGLLNLRRAPRHSRARAAIGATELQALLRRRTRVTGLRVVEAKAEPFSSENGILSEICAVRLGERVGIQRYRLAVSRPGLRTPLRFDTLVKTKAADEVVEGLTVELATLCDERLGRLFHRHRHELGLTGCHERELALYEWREPRLRRHAPRCFGTDHDRLSGLWTVVLERVEEADTKDVGASLDDWDATRMRAVVGGLASIQSVGLCPVARRTASRWLAAERRSDQMAAMAPLWQAMVEYASHRFSQWCPALPSVQERLVATLSEWWPRVLALPHSLVHNDFNPRNLALRATGGEPRLCVFDWELTAFGLPQRDLAEFLCFVAGEKLCDDRALANLVEQHRVALSTAARVDLDPRTFRVGFALGLQQFLISRLPMYALIDRFKPQSFLPRVVKNAGRLYEVSRTWVSVKAQEPVIG